MQLIDQHTKRIMEGCKERARDAGLRFSDESLEYIVTNRDMLELSPKVMIPTLYDYWVHDVEVLKEKGRYELYPSNPYETVINTRPPISFYNDNNPDWLNVMIFYHVLAHIDFFQNNQFFRHTWQYDLAGQALADKRLIGRLRSEKGRWVDYVIEFSRGIDNLVGYYQELERVDRPPVPHHQQRIDFYFDLFLQQIKGVRTTEYMKEIERYNESRRLWGEGGDDAFFSEVVARYPEFESMLQKYAAEEDRQRHDLLQFLMVHSPFLNRPENRWMKSVMEIIRSTAVYLQPQIRTKIMNEGWASYWHEKLFMLDDRIRGREVSFARIHAGVTSLPRVGLNPYALGMRLFQDMEQAADRGRYSAGYRRLQDVDRRRRYDDATGKGTDYIFHVREHFADNLFLAVHLDQEFVDRHRLFVAGRRVNRQRMVREYYVKSRKAEDFREMLQSMLYHPPTIVIGGGDGGRLNLIHRFEGRPLVQEYIKNTLLGIEFLWGGPVRLETSEPQREASEEDKKAVYTWQRVEYLMENRTLSRNVL